MSPQTFVMLMAVILGVMAWWSNYSKRDKIYCSFTDEDKTMTYKFVKKKSHYVVFEGKRYDVKAEYVKSLLWDRGIVGMLFPQRVPALDYTYASRWPIDPATGKPAIISPEVRNAINKEEWVKSYAKGFTPPSSKKGTFIQQYLPWVSIILVLMVAVYFYTNMQALGHSLADIANRLNAISR